MFHTLHPLHSHAPRYAARQRHMHAPAPNYTRGRSDASYRARRRVPDVRHPLPPKKSVFLCYLSLSTFRLHVPLPFRVSTLLNLFSQIVYHGEVTSTMRFAVVFLSGPGPATGTADYDTEPGFREKLFGYVLPIYISNNAAT